MPGGVNSDVAFQPLLHGKAAFLAHGKVSLSFHFTLFVAKLTVPKFRVDGAGLHIYLFGCLHGHIGNNTETEQATRAGEWVFHGKAVQFRRSL